MSDSATLRDYIGVVRRRKWTVLQAVLLVPAAAVLFSLWQTPLFEGTAEVLLSNRSLASSLVGTQDPTLSQQPERIAQTQADLARVPEVAGRTLRVVGLSDRTAQDLLESSSVSAKTDADLLEFHVTDPVRGLAVRLATAYASQFVAYRNELDTSALVQAEKDVAGRIAELEAAGNRKSALYANLVEKEQQLRTMVALQTSNAFVVRPADEAAQVQPRPVRNGILALALGVILGIGLAFLREALDTRVRSADEIAERLGLPLLARLPEPPRSLRERDGLVMLEEPSGPHAEPFRMLRTNLEFVTHERADRLIMVTSAHQTEGKSTTVANLAVALASAGRRVVLVDLDLRRPLIDRLFALEGRPGLTNVVLGQTRLDDALAHIAITPPGLRADVEVVGQRESARSASALDELIAIRGADDRAFRYGNGNGATAVWGNGAGERSVDGLLEVLPAGRIPPNAGEFVTSRGVEVLLESLRRRADFVLIDSPPLLHVGDALALSTRVDALLLVTRIKLVRRPALAELRRVLGGSPTPALGFVEAGAELDEGYGYGYGYVERKPARPTEVKEVV